MYINFFNKLSQSQKNKIKNIFFIKVLRFYLWKKQLLKISANNNNKCLLREYKNLFSQIKSIDRNVAKNVSFLGYDLQIIDGPSFVWQYKEIFLDEYYKFLSLIKTSEKKIIYDCGANIGMSILYFKKLYPHSKIIAFEADPNIQEILKSNLINNNINDVEVVSGAVWINGDGVNFSADGADGGFIATDNCLPKIKSVRLRDYLEREESVDMLKIDIEGAEAEVLFDCSGQLQKIENLFIEYHGFKNKQQALGKILSLLTDNSFRYYLKTITECASPLVNHRVLKDSYDLQLNIFAYKDKL